jgi:hypothetical protein
MREGEAERDRAEARDHQRRQRLAEERGAEKGGSDGA